jgi:hypothetical protein
MNGKNAAFRWDNLGLAAYWRENDSSAYNTNKFVRFYHNGIYGCIGNDDWTPTSITDIYNNCPFSLTWNGFSLKNSEGSVRISTNDDI